MVINFNSAGDGVFGLLRENDVGGAFGFTGLHVQRGFTAGEFVDEQDLALEGGKRQGFALG